jgi:hypothetical protein
LGLRPLTFVEASEERRGSCRSCIEGGGGEESLGEGRQIRRQRENVLEKCKEKDQEIETFALGVLDCCDNILWMCRDYTM